MGEMTPSEAHDSAWKRDISHDEMVYGCLCALRKSSKHKHIRRLEKTETVYELSYSRCEQLMEPKNGRQWFADIYLRYDADVQKYQHHSPNERKLVSTHLVYEIKPIIYSVGAVLRQVEIQRVRLKSFVDDYDSDSAVIAIVRAGDPKIDLLLKMGERSVLVWDGEKLEWKSNE